MAQPLTSHTTRMDLPMAHNLQRLLEERGWQFHPVPHALFAARKDKVNVVYYHSGKLVVQGRGTQEFVEFVLEPEITGEARLGYEEVLNPDLLVPRLGVDESGKGDFFGPLCIAGVYANADIVRSWQAAGVRDSKSITSDKKIAELAGVIRETPGVVASVVPVGNEAYNRLHEKMGSVNRVLAWGHARVIENLMEQRGRMNPPPERVISDQFAHDKSTVAGALMALGREIELVQRHKAESDLAVAAASILARHEFVTRLRKLGEDYGVTFPKGASAAVDKVAKEFVEAQGPGKLRLVSKLHFRTALRAQGLPEPPKSEWRRS